jgi:hypothetical protein
MNAVGAFYEKYRVTDDATASIRPEPDEWSLKEITGHLVNSASNNQQRFIGLQFVKEMQFPEYQKFHLKWLNAERFNEMNFSDLLLLWRQYNVFIAHIIVNLDPACMENILVMPDGKRNTLEFLARDYVRHLKDHLEQFEATLKKATGLS